MGLGSGKSARQKPAKSPVAPPKRGITASGTKNDRSGPASPAEDLGDARRSRMSAAKKSPSKATVKSAKAATRPKKPTATVAKKTAKPAPAPKKKAAPAKPVAVKKAAPKKPTPIKSAAVAKKPSPKSVPKKPAPTPKSPTPAKKAVPVAKKTRGAPAVVPKKQVAAKPVSPPVKAPAAKKSAPTPKAIVAPTPAPSKKQASAPKAPTSVKPAAPAPVAAAPALRKPTSTKKSALTAPPAPTLTPLSGAKASFLPHMSAAIAPPPQVVVKKDPKLANNWKSKDASQLTDAEVLAMPDAEYMNDKQMSFFRLKLTQLKQSILASADQTTEHLREDTVIVPDPADRATIEEEHALELRTRDRERKLLKKIEQSIARIDGGDYGYCDETGEPIGVGRLLARPTATLSLEAQQRRELKQRMFGD